MQLPWRSIHAPVRRPAPDSWLPSATACLLAAQVSICALQWGVREVSDGRDVLLAAGGVSADGLRHGRLWEPLTAMFLSAGGAAAWLLPLHWLVLALTGRPLETVVGRRHLVQLYLVAGSVGGLAQVAAGWATHGADTPVAGAAAANCGVFFALACVMPRTVLLPGVPSARGLKIVHGAAGAAAALTAAAASGGHALALGGLAGGLTGCLSMRALGFGRRAPDTRPTGGGAAAGEKAMSAPTAAAHGKLAMPRFTERERRMTAREFVSEQIDPILDKISRHGLGSLTDEERRVLDKGREKVSQVGRGGV